MPTAVGKRCGDGHGLARKKGRCDTELERIVAVKVKNGSGPGSCQDADRFLREARVAAKLSHPAIVSVHDARWFDQTCILVSEFVAGPTLADRLATGALPPREVAELVARVAQRSIMPISSASSIGTSNLRTSCWTRVASLIWLTSGWPSTNRARPH